MFDQVLTLTDLYENYAILAGLVFLVSLLLTPITGVIAQAIGIIDQPAHKRDQDDKTRSRRIHKKSMPKFGGIAIVIAFLVGILLALDAGLLQMDSYQLAHIVIGVIFLTIGGFLDDYYDLSSQTQLMVHFVAAFIITLSGIHIDLIEVMQVSINFEVITWEFSILDWPLSISPVSDLITILWIVGVINALNWVSGIDGLAAMMSLFAAVTMLFIGVRTEALFAAALAAILAGSISGFLPYNFPPARTFNGSIGDMVQGYLLAILAIISSAKLSTSLILLALPIIDAVWVVLGRLRRHRKEINNPLDILKISDKTHLHHRFLDMGFSVRQTLAIETIIFLGFCIMAYYFAGFSDQTLVVMIAVFTCFVLFVIVAIVRSMAIKRRANKVEEKPKAQVVEEESPEEQYTY